MYKQQPNYTLIARFMGPTWGPPGSCRPRWVPCRSHEPCYLGSFQLIHDQDMYMISLQNDEYRLYMQGKTVRNSTYNHACTKLRTKHFSINEKPHCHFVLFKKTVASIDIYLSICFQNLKRTKYVIVHSQQTLKVLVSKYHYYCFKVWRISVVCCTNLYQIFCKLSICTYCHWYARDLKNWITEANKFILIVYWLNYSAV